MKPFITVTMYPTRYDDKGYYMKESVMVAHILTISEERRQADSGFFSFSWAYIGKIFLLRGEVSCCENRQQIEELILEASK